MRGNEAVFDGVGDLLVLNGLLVHEGHGVDEHAKGDVDDGVAQEAEGAGFQRGSGVRRERSDSGMRSE